MPTQQCQSTEGKDYLRVSITFTLVTCGTETRPVTMNISLG